ncbi:hypothetical protein PUNSTDRAFT_86611 [Punctularia strigosozonata HHB-11173 SS5]|uniref:uncharacterized protein n=1 Tax=Punctularia strigosozonata (strain HHB-11173) TaxID=741275 RepID=UPI0004416829|nr:uncharacterized protein PUNSTDRAFT_86611 [Punctularia strigosozonata HHB-11173 SS5]EIN10065.1 hypothetical protein PUNSTDRAFT_86611 [Punctularia strigosozonata HHB-11173 SS5]
MPPDRSSAQASMYDLHPPAPLYGVHKSPKKAANAAGPAKGKGAVRAKTGCYTCRIRRKKCDETRDPQGGCETCKRLHLECLGFGTKRPEWMRGGSLEQMRERIKDFLASQGMIKGQSSLQRSVNELPEMLILSPHGVPLEHSPTYSARSMSVEDHPPRAQLSSVRYDYGSARSQIDPNLLEHHSISRPMTNSPHTSSDNELPNGYPTHHGTGYHRHARALQVQPGSLLGYVISHQPPHSTYPPQCHPSLAKTSSFSPLYHESFPDNPADDYYDVSSLSDPHLVGYYQPGALNQDALVSYYMNTVVKIQYLVADPSVSGVILRFIKQSPLAHLAVCKLASLHQNPRNRQALSSGTDEDLPLMLSEAASAMTRSAKRPDLGAALAALQIVSCILFAGGRGPWRDWLDIACQCVSSILDSPEHGNAADALRKSDDMTRFVVMTTMWFDVLAAVTLMHPPRFLKEYRIIFGGPSIDGVSSNGSDYCDMRIVMGCENNVVLALAEISALGHWKEVEKKHGRLSMPLLVKKGQEIEQRLLPPTRVRDPYAYTSSADRTAQARQATSNIFRASAKVYLHSVLSGDSPACPEIKQAVQETVDCFQAMPRDGRREIVRMTVFCICICGCLTDDLKQRQFLLDLLEEQAIDRVGNCEEVKNVMKAVWHRRGANPHNPIVPWRDVMQTTLGGDKNRLLLLV